MNGDLRRRIETVLREHHIDISVEKPTCCCGADGGKSEDDMDAHRADVLASVLQPDIDTIAQAIVASMEEQCDFRHVGLIGAHVDWRKVARAAVDAWTAS
jgi:hypothetical protein